MSSKSFVLTLEDGREARIEGVERADREGRYVFKGAYGALLESPLAGLFRKRAPGDHVSVELEGFALVGGDRVRVLGEVTEHTTATTPGDEGGMHEAPARVPSVVRASQLIIEGNAPSTVKAKEKRLQRPRRRARVRIVLRSHCAPAWLAFRVMPFAETWHAEGTSEGQPCDVYVQYYFYNGSGRCSVSLTCGGEDLYGGFGMGQMACDERDGVLTGEYADVYDGDAALRIFLSPARPGTLTWSTGSLVRQVALVAAERSFVP